jgi:hypothetical protein
LTLSTVTPRERTEQQEEKRTMPEDERFRHVQVYCPECRRMISPGEYTMCPYFEAAELDVTDTEQVFKQLFTCHVKCGTKVEYHYYKNGERVTTTVDPVENESMLLEILKRVVDH